MKWLIISFIGAIVVALAILRIYGHYQDQQIKPWISYTRLLFVAEGCDEYKAHNGGWPDSLEELHTFRIDLNNPWTQDAWGRDLIIIQFNPTLGYGEVSSCGRDGKPGGTGLDKDLSVRFPLVSNKAWNKQEGVGLKPPAQLKYDTNWFEENGYDK